MNSTVLGVFAALGLLGLMVLGAGGDGGRFVDPLGLGIVVGGLTTASLVSFRRSQLRGMRQALKQIFLEDPSIEPEIKNLVNEGRS